MVGLHPRDEDWLSGNRMAGVWFETLEDASAPPARHAPVPFGEYEAVAVSPLASGRLDPPDICLIYATPAQMILMINGLQWSRLQELRVGLRGRVGLRRLVGAGAESCGEPSVSIPCFAERRYGGVLDDELLMATPAGVRAEDDRGPRGVVPQRPPLPDPPYGIQQDARAGLGYSYVLSDQARRLGAPRGRCACAPAPRAAPTGPARRSTDSAVANTDALGRGLGPQVEAAALAADASHERRSSSTSSGAARR